MQAAAARTYERSSQEPSRQQSAGFRRSCEESWARTLRPGPCRLVQIPTAAFETEVGKCSSHLRRDIRWSGRTRPNRSSRIPPCEPPPAVARASRKVNRFEAELRLSQFVLHYSPPGTVPIERSDRRKGSRGSPRRDRIGHRWRREFPSSPGGKSRSLSVGPEQTPRVASTPGWRHRRN